MICFRVFFVIVPWVIDLRKFVLSIQRKFICPSVRPLLSNQKHYSSWRPKASPSPVDGPAWVLLCRMATHIGSTNYDVHMLD